MLKNTVNGRKVRGRRRYQIIDGIKINISYAETKRKAEKKGRLENARFAFGQKFMNDMMSKVQWLRQNYPDLDIEVDGGVGPSTIQACAEVCGIKLVLKSFPLLKCNTRL